MRNTNTLKVILEDVANISRVKSYHDNFYEIFASKDDKEQSKHKYENGINYFA